jgi:sulfonate transport system substrate-binding protein
MKRFKMGGVPEHFNLPWRLAIEDGDFQKNGIEIHWSDMSGGTGQMIKGLQTGSIDIAVLLTEGITKAILQGLDASIIAIYVQTPLSWGVHVPFSSDINSIEGLENKAFAISREASGSQLMAFVNAYQKNWDLTKLSFNVVGDLYGGLWSLNQNESQGFLWEKYTTQPFVDQNKCRCVGEVKTPWPCFVIAVNKKIAKENAELIKSICEIVQLKASALKKNTDAAAMISWRYNLSVYQVSMWLSDTEWSTDGQIKLSDFELVVQYLKQMKLISEEESIEWEQKLF